MKTNYSTVILSLFFVVAFVMSCDQKANDESIIELKIELPEGLNYSVHDLLWGRPDTVISIYKEEVAECFKDDIFYYLFSKMNRNKL